MIEPFDRANPKLTETFEKKIREALAKSTEVVNWYPHGYDRTVRGPFGRWFTCSEVNKEYEHNVASVYDEVEYCATAMNAVPVLLNEIDSLRKQVNRWHKESLAMNKLRREANLERDKLFLELGKFADVSSFEYWKDRFLRLEEQAIQSLTTLANIADKYDSNGLDDEARKFWGKDLEYTTETLPSDVVLYSGRGGATLLTLEDCLKAREVLDSPKGKV